MQVAFYSLLTLVSLLIFYQDLKDRLVSLWVLLLYAGLIIAYTIYEKGIDIILQNAISTVAYFALCFGIIFLYYFIKERQFPKIMDVKLGWADVIICMSIGISLDVLLLVLFFTVSFVISAIIGIVLQSRNKTVPLAGFLVILYLVFICISAYFPLDLVFL